jgi:ribosomal protein L20A (L18A)
MKSNKEIFASMESRLELLWERMYRNNLKMKLETDQDRKIVLEKRANRAGIEAENAGFAYASLLNDLGIKQKLDIYKIMIKALNEVNEIYKEELEELRIKESRVG